MSNTNALLVIAKRPTPGQTKTRLTPPLTAEQAAALYECFLVDTLDLVRRVPEMDPLIAYLPAEARAYFAALAPDFGLVLQEGAGLGERLDNALTGCLNRGYERAVIMNSDGPTLPASHLARAFDALSRRRGRHPGAQRRRRLLPHRRQTARAAAVARGAYEHVDRAG